MSLSLLWKFSTSWEHFLPVFSAPWEQMSVLLCSKQLSVVFLSGYVKALPRPWRLDWRHQAEFKQRVSDSWKYKLPLWCRVCAVRRCISLRPSSPIKRLTDARDNEVAKLCHPFTVVSSLHSRPARWTNPWPLWQNFNLISCRCSLQWEVSPTWFLGNFVTGKQKK